MLQTRSRPLLILAALVLAGCATTPPSPPDPVLAGLNQAAGRIARQLTKLSASNPASNVTAYPAPKTGPLAVPVTLAWSGPLEPAVGTVADLIGFHVRTVGRPPSLPVLVRVDAHRRPAFLLLQDIGWQAGSYAGITVYPARHLVEIVYIGRAGTPPGRSR
ncbi:MAG: DotD/TraH family lipoprotein [Acidiferrobacterales bacterium]